MFRPARPLRPAAIFIIIASLCLIGASLPVQASGSSVFLILRAPEAEHIRAITSGVESLAREKGLELKILATADSDDGSGQAALINQALKEGCRALIIDPADESVLPALAALKRAGVPIIILGRALNNDEFKQAGLNPFRVLADHDMAVAMVLNHLKQELGSSAEVLIIGSSSRGPATDRIARAVRALGGLTIRAALSVNGRPEAAYRLIADRFLEQQPAEAILCADDKAIPSILKALQGQGFSQKILITGYGNLESVRPLLESGRLSATIDPRWDLVGRTALATALKILAGATPPRIQQIPAELILARLYGRRVTAVVPKNAGADGRNLIKGMESVARRYGLKIQELGLSREQAEQTAQLTNLAQTKPAAVLMLTGTAPVAGQGIRALAKAGVPLITIGHRLEAAKTVGHIGPDNLTGGQMAGQMVVRALDGKGRVVELVGRPDSDLTHDLGMGFSRALAHHPKVEIVAREVADFKRSRAEAAITRMLDRGQAFEAVFAHNEQMILGALDALKKFDGSGHRPVLIGYGGRAEGRRALAKGELSGTVDYHLEALGRLALFRAAEWLRGKDIPSEELAAPKPVNR